MDLKSRWVNIYNIYGVCYGTTIDPQMAEGPQMYESAGRRPISAYDYTPWAFPHLKDKEPLGGDDALPPCTFGTPLMNYFDRADVRTALHIDS